MIKQADCLAIIPARKDSKGLPNKNMLPLGNKPLIGHSISVALDSPYVSEVVVSTDGPEIAEYSRNAGASVPFIRPADLASDEAKNIDVLRHAVDFYEQVLNRSFKYILLLQPTSPLRTTANINEAFELFLAQGAQSLQSVTSTSSHPYLLRKFRDGNLEPYQKDEKSHLRRQDLEPLYVLNGAIYIVTRDLLMNGYALVGDHNVGYLMSREQSIDIDDEFDLKLAQFIWSGTGDY